MTVVDGIVCLFLFKKYFSTKVCLCCLQPHQINTWWKFANSSDKNVFYDGTNLKPETRFDVLTHLDKTFQVEALVFDESIETVLERAQEAAKNGSREGFHTESFHEKDLRLMAKWFKKPIIEEGFDSIHEYRPQAEPAKEMKVKFK